MLGLTSWIKAVVIQSIWGFLALVADDVQDAEGVVGIKGRRVVDEHIHGEEVRGAVVVLTLKSRHIRLVKVGILQLKAGALKKRQRNQANSSVE